MTVPPEPLNIALVCLHTSPADEPGSGDAGGMNVVVLHQAQALAREGHRVEIVTRRTGDDDPDSRDLFPDVTLRLLEAGPRHPVAKGDHEAFIDEFGMRLAGLGPYDVIHSHHWFSGMAALPVARAHGIPHVQSYHSVAADIAAPLSDGERAESPGRMAGEAWLARDSDALEAAASGVPVVAAASGGLREAVLDGRTGVVLASRDPENWASAITRVLEDHELAKRFALEGRRCAETHSWTRSARGLLAVYASVLLRAASA